MQETIFVRESERPATTIEIRYNDRDGLRALGIPVPPSPPVIDDDVERRESADPFPGDRRFAEPPP
ncbi:MAG: hypothetical protein IT372_24450 [Polyangiaceae bacterium]|nr:hypothetical protein [Polyangiaceae bacterium]